MSPASPRRKWVAGLPTLQGSAFSRLAMSSYLLVVQQFVENLAEHDQISSCASYFTLWISITSINVVHNSDSGFVRGYYIYSLVDKQNKLRIWTFNQKWLKLRTLFCNYSQFYNIGKSKQITWSSLSDEEIIKILTLRYAICIKLWQYKMEYMRKSNNGNS